MDVFLFIWALPTVLTLKALWVAWNMWTADFVEGEVASYKIKVTPRWLPQFLRDIKIFAVVHCKIKGQLFEVETDGFLKPVGHRVRLWVKKQKDRTKAYMPGEIFFLLGSSLAWMALYFSVTDWVFVFLTFAFIGPIIIDGIFLNSWRSVSLTKISKKITLQEYNKLKEGPLAYEDAIAIRHLRIFGAICTCAITLLGLIAYDGWTNAP